MSNERTHMDIIREAWFAGETIQINCSPICGWRWLDIEADDNPIFQGKPEDYRIKPKDEEETP